MASYLERVVRAVRTRAALRLDSFLAQTEQRSRAANRDGPAYPLERSIALSESVPSYDGSPGSVGPDGQLKKKPPNEIYGDLPVSVWIDWKLSTVRGALADHAYGNFGRASMLTEGMLSDDRVQTALNGRIKGITKCDPVMTPADVPDGQAVVEELEDVWEDILPEETVEQAVQWATFEGFFLAEIIWEPWPVKDAWLPRLKVWHPLYIYYRVDTRKYVAITMEGPIDIDPNDPKWFLYVPFGAYRGWIRGAVRSCSIPWLIRQFALRDWARFSEVHGLPIRLAKYPAMAPAEDKARFVAGIRNLGAETTIGLPIQGGPDAAAWSAELLEAKDKSWQSFEGLRDACDQSITLAIRGTNLTTSVGAGNSGNRAAAETHRDEDSDYALADRKKLCRMLRTHLFKWYCIFNHGSTECVPKKIELVDPDGEDRESEAKASEALAVAIKAWKDAGVPIDARKKAEDAGEPLVEGREDEANEKLPEPATPFGGAKPDAVGPEKKTDALLPGKPEAPAPGSNGKAALPSFSDQK